MKENIDSKAMQRNAKKAVSLLKYLANESRLVILCLLADREHSVGELNNNVRLSQSALSQHLAALREAKLVKTRRESQTVYYRINGQDAIRIIKVLHELYCPRI